MAKFRRIMTSDDGGTDWFLSSPTSFFEACRLAWLLWRHPDRVAALVGVEKEYRIANFEKDAQ